jgi:Transposase, Mutator family
MPVHRQKKDTTTNPSGSTQEQTAIALPAQQAFQQYLRELARSGIRVVLEGVMCEELDALIGVGWGECSPKRKGYRNGFYSRDLVTSSGRIEGINVPTRIVRQITCYCEIERANAIVRGLQRGVYEQSFRGRFFLSLKGHQLLLSSQEAKWATRTQASVPSATGLQPPAPHRS